VSLVLYKFKVKYTDFFLLQVSDRDATQELTETSDKPEQDSSAGSDDQSQQKVKDEETKGFNDVVMMF